MAYNLTRVFTKSVEYDGLDLDAVSAAIETATGRLISEIHMNGKRFVEVLSVQVLPVTTTGYEMADGSIIKSDGCVIIVTTKQQD